ncbi:MAG: ATP-dependent Clp protease proteolytic subunit [Actinomycetota bacterium]
MHERTNMPPAPHAGSEEPGLPGLERLRLDPALEAYGHLLRRRVILLGSELKDEAASLVAAQLLQLEDEDPASVVHLYINSAGGTTSAAMAVYDTMQALQPDVSTICVGRAASAAAILLASGAPGKRFALPHARIWIQHPASEFHGGLGDLEIRAREAVRERRLVEEVLARHTGQPLERIELDTERDLILSAEEARAYGVVDAVIGDRRLPHLAR